MDTLRKIILLTNLGEKIATNMNEKLEQYPKIRESLDFCWSWIEKRELDEYKIYELLDDEDEDDLVGYMIYEQDEFVKKELAALLGIVSYISHSVLSINKLPIPQFLMESGEENYEKIISDIEGLNIAGCDVE